MATLEALVRAGLLHKVAVPLRARQLPTRLLYGTQRFIAWLDDEVPMIKATMWGGDLPAVEQAAVTLADFVGGARFDHPSRIRYLKPKESGVWELKTGDLRIFGWFPSHDCFVATNGADAYDAKQPGGYAALIRGVVKCRERLNLDEPKFVQSTELRDVISG